MQEGLLTIRLRRVLHQSDYGERFHHSLPTTLPDHVLANIFHYLPSMQDLLSCMLVCREWHGVAERYDEEIWEHYAREELYDVVMQKNVNGLFGGEKNGTWRERLRSFRYAWNPNDASKNTFVRNNCFTVHRHPVAQSTDAIRSKIGESTGVHAWDLTWQGPLGTSAVVGVASKHAAMHSPGYLPLIGSDDQSWGWNLVDNTLLHNGAVLCSYPRTRNAPKYIIGDRIRMVVDCDRRCVFFENSHSGFLGMAFTQLPPIRLHCALSAVYGRDLVELQMKEPLIGSSATDHYSGNTEVTCVYVGQPPAG